MNAVAVDMPSVNQFEVKAAMKQFEIQLKIFVNQRLYEKGTITQEMYIKAKEYIMKH